MESFVKPRKLEPGDHVAIVSLSWGGPAVFPHIYEAGINFLKENGLKVKEYSSARCSPKRLYENPKMRAEDLNQAYRDPEIKAIFSSIGGDDSIRILPYLDEKVIKANPKIIMGYSDSTTYLTYINQLGHVTFNGPAVMAGMGQMHNYPEAAKHFRQLLFKINPSYDYEPYGVYSEGYPNWSNLENVGKINENIRDEAGWNWLQGYDSAEGILFGGCLDVLEIIKGTDFWPKKSFWDGKILFLETSEECMPPSHVKWILRSFGMMGVFDKVSGVLVGRSRGYTVEQKKELNKAIIDVVVTEFDKPDLPVVTNVDFGHTDPQLIMPLGIRMEINSSRKTLKLVESPVVG
jgi:muramoyltetrapeptide carboxypeptidase LdcA involved in peptidoglycan recycling